MPLLDSHFHLWHPAELRYPWLDEIPALRRRFGPDEYRAGAEGVPVNAAIFVEANPDPAQGLAEARRVSRLAAANPWIAGIVAFVDLTAGKVGEALDALAELPLVRGIRHNIQGNAPGFAIARPYVEGAREVGRRGLVFDLCATHDQLPEVIALVDRAPDTRFVLDHCAKPAIREGLLDPWRGDLVRLAERPNVSCKISGLLTEAGPGAMVETVLPYASHAVETFGVERVMYGSDWPVLTLAGSHSGWYDVTRSLTRGWSTDEARGFYDENARRAYGIAPAAPLSDPSIDRV
jgi:L-fuconolactonase